MKHNWQKWVIGISILGALQFFVLSSLAMEYYPGGTIHDRISEGYSFFTNYFSDLGRTRSWNGENNWKSNILFQTSLTTVGISLCLFFFILPTLFKSEEAKLLALIATIAGLISALCYIGIAHTPLNVNYYRHTLFVRAGFIAFLAMSLFYTLAIQSDQHYPNMYARAFGWFMLILGVQIVIMLFGPRSWHSPEALLLQATAQKIVVYSEMLCMLFQCIGAYRIIQVQKITD